MPPRPQGQFDLPRFSERLLEMQNPSQHQLRKAILSSLAFPDADRVAKAWADPRHRDFVSGVLDADFSLSAGNARDRFSFQRVAVPFVELLSQDRFSNTVNGNLCRRLYEFVSNHELFWDNAYRCLVEVLGEGVADPRARGDGDATTYVPESLADVLRPFARLCVLMLTRVTDGAVNPRWERFLGPLERGAEMQPDDTAFLDAVRRCRHVLDGVQRRRAREEQVRREDAEQEDLRVAQEMQFGIRVPREEEPLPGDLRPDGPRHDNDSADFREIAVLPTDEEVLCPHPPYLPHQDTTRFPAGSRFIPNNVDRHLDIQFRLLREDMLCDVRRAVSQFAAEAPLARLGPAAVRYAVKGDNADRLQCSLFRRLTVDGIQPHIRDGVGVQISFDQIPAIRTQNKRNRENYWKEGRGSKMLEVGSLVAVAFHAPTVLDQPVDDDHPAPRPERILFATVVLRGRDDLGRDAERCTTLTLRPMGGAAVEMFLNYCRIEPRDRTEHVLLQVRGHFFVGYEPVLRALQRQDISRLPFLSRIVPNYCDAGAVVNPATLPAFVSDTTRLDLSCVVRRGRRVPPELTAVQIDDFEVLRGLLAAHLDDLVLDATQTDAFALALTREVSLIQGPPGTGKTYVGVRIVQALISNAEHDSDPGWQAERGRPVARGPRPTSKLPILPILCICFTNHALDQFLMDLVRDGVVSVNDIVRVGGRSKCEELKPCSLRDRSRQLQNQHDRGRFGQLKRQCNNLENDLQRLERLLHVSDVQLIRETDMIEFLEDFERDLFDEISNAAPAAPGAGVQNHGAVVAADISGDPDREGDGDRDGEGEGWQVAGGHAALLDAWFRGDVDGARRAVWARVCAEFRAEQRGHIRSCVERYEAVVAEVKEVDAASQLRAVKAASIVGFTTSGCAKYDTLLHALRPRVVVCEEAGEVFESHVIASLTSGAECLILIGDHQQLRPKPSNYSLSVESNNGYNLDISLFERLVNSNVATNVALDTQRRMRPEISQLIRMTLYPRLLDGPSVHDYPPTPRGFSAPLWFLDHTHREDGAEQREGSSSQSNAWEADMVCALVRYVVRQGYSADQIAVLTPYVGQLLQLRRRLQGANVELFLDERDAAELDAIDSDDENAVAEGAPAAVGARPQQRPRDTARVAALHRCVRLATVDNFQGEEADVVIISTVRNNAQGRTGFLKIENRVNVMLSRAKVGMYVFGSRDTILRDRRAKMFHKIIDHLEGSGQVAGHLPLRCERHGNAIHATNPADIPLDGGCHDNCGFRLSCGHVCPRACHPDDVEHLGGRCLEPCARMIEQCGHPCRLSCSDVCGGCLVPRSMELTCGHTIENMPCHVYEDVRAGRNDPPQCKTQLEIAFADCDHVARVTCARATSLGASIRCLQRCGRLRECGHPCTSKCTSCLVGEGGVVQHSGDCGAPCERTLMCGHLCEVSPCHPADECPPCSKPCAIRCAHSQCPKTCKKPCPLCAQPCTWRCTVGHDREGDAPMRECLHPCASPCRRLPCDVRCDQTLECGHPCPSICGERCPTPKHCPLCAREGAPNTEGVRDQIVDMIMQTSLAEYDTEEETLVVLACGHAFTTETMDGLTELKAYYDFDETVGMWMAARPLDELDVNAAVPKCPTCRTPVGGVNRYNVVVNWCMVTSCQRKWQIAAQHGYSSIVSQVARLESDMGDAAGESTVAKRVARRVEATLKAAGRLVELADSAPTAGLFGMEENFAARHGGDRDQVSTPRFVKPIAMPRILSLMGRLQVMQLKTRFELRRAAADEGEGEGDDPLAVWRAAGAWHGQALVVFDELRRVCETERCLSKLGDSTRIHARYLLALVDDYASCPVDPAICAEHGEQTLRERHVELLDGVQRFVDAGALPAEIFGKAVADLRAAHLGAERYEAVTDAEREMLFRAMAPDIGSGIGSFGGHWYKCSNGHVYTIGECGGAMVESNCPECGATIGGSGHRHAEGTSVAEEFRRFV